MKTETPKERKQNGSKYLACIWCGADLPADKKYAKYCSKKCGKKAKGY